MPNLRPLYKAKNLAGLQEFYDVSKTVSRKPLLLCSTAQKIFDQAGKEELAGDEEMAFVYYMKYVAVITLVHKTVEYKNDRAFYDIKIGNGNVAIAINKADKLSTSLQNRYKLLSEKAVVDATLLEQEKIEAEAEEKKRSNKDTKENNINASNGGQIGDISDVSLSSRRLFQLLNDKTMNVLLLDARPSASFAESHMTFRQCINVPQENVKAGMSAAALAKLLPSESKELFTHRRSADLVVLFDWSTTESMLSPGSNLYTLKNILLKWDPGIIYKNMPLILEGGFEDWLLTYPQYTSNPRAKPPPISDPFSDFLLDDIEYPNLNDSLLDRSTKPAIGYPNIPTETGSPSRPGIDRGSKAAAIQTYEERNKTVTELLEASEEGANTSLELAKTILKAEKDWETLRLRKEKEAEEEMKVNLQRREEALLLNIDKLEESQRIKDAENQALRSQLEEYRRKDVDETARLADKQRGIRQRKDGEIHLRIQKKEEEMRIVAKEREEKAKERLRKVEEDRKIRKQEEARRRQQEQLDHGSQDKNENGTYYTPLVSDSSSNSLMKRSHSSPNIAQLMNGDTDDLTVKHKAPQFDRAIKPLQKPLRSDVNAARQRNFNGVLGRVGKGLTGLKNLGNTCYMNSILQCINNTEPIAEYFCSGDYRGDINYSNKTKGDIVCEVGAVVRAMWLGQFRSIQCNELKDKVGEHKTEFKGSQQQDSHEFLFFLINWLHDDLNQFTGNKKPIKDSKMDHMSDAEKQWYDFIRCNDSIILRLFYGQQKSTVRCDVCGKESSTYEPFNHLSLPLPNSSRCTISECMKLYLSGERISGWRCPSCKELRDATKKFDLLRLPRILVIHFKRFYHDGWSTKKQTYVEFPLDRLDMETFTPIPQQRYTRYELYGVSNHYGTMEGGHYTAYCKNAVYSKWYKYDDSEVTDISSSDVKSGAAYILFYTALDNKVPAR